MTTVKLKKEKVSAKFGVVFPKDTDLNYSKELECVEHPKMKNIWIKVSEKDLKKS
jgi:hypothetical protein